MSLADAFAYRDDYPFPADHSAEPQRERLGNLDPIRDEFGAAVERAPICSERGDLISAEVALFVLDQQTNRFRHQIHVIAGSAGDFPRNPGNRSVLLYLVGDVARQYRQ
jgi:hypothetical protein